MLAIIPLAVKLHTLKHFRAKITLTEHDGSPACSPMSPMATARYGPSLAAILVPLISTVGMKGLFVSVMLTHGYNLREQTRNNKQNSDNQQHYPDSPLVGLDQTMRTNRRRTMTTTTKRTRRTRTRNNHNNRNQNKSRKKNSINEYNWKQ